MKASIHGDIDIISTKVLSNLYANNQKQSNSNVPYRCQVSLGKVKI